MSNRTWKLTDKSLSELFASESVISTWIDRKSQFSPLLSYPSFARPSIAINCYQLKKHQFRLNQKPNQYEATRNKKKLTKNKERNKQTLKKDKK